MGTRERKGIVCPSVQAAVGRFTEGLERSVFPDISEVGLVQRVSW